MVGGEDGEVEVVDQVGTIAGEGGHPVSRANCSMSELEHVLESVCQYLPISEAEWDLGPQQHSRCHPELERTGDQLKKNQ